MVHSYLSGQIRGLHPLQSYRPSCIVSMLAIQTGLYGSERAEMESL
jgi:hypothetical protein